MRLLARPRPLVLVALLAAAGSWPAGVGAQIRYLDNGVLRLGVDLARGGAISYLSESGSGESVVNVRDLGRYIQQSYYSGPDPFVPPGATQHPAYAGWGWNPVQAGDVYGNRSRVIDERDDGTTLYVACVPKQWALDDVDAACTLESWIRLDANRVHVRSRLTNARDDTTRYSGRHQELPAVYTVGRLHRLFTYTGDTPFTGDALSRIVNSGPPWEYWTSTENWSALVDDDGWGLGVCHPGAYLTVGGFHGAPGTGGPTSVNTGYIAPLHTEVLDHDIVYEYAYTLVLGDLEDDIRSYAYAAAGALGPDHVFTRDRAHCLPRDLTDTAPPFAGFWPLTLDEPGPKILLPPAHWHAGDVPRLRVTAAFHTVDDRAEVFFAGPDGVFGGDRRLQLTIVPDGQVRTYEVDLASHPLYAGVITRLRFDPIQLQTPGDRVDLYAVTTRDVSAARAPAAPGGRGGNLVVEPARPNPFNPVTTLRFRLREPARVGIRIHDLAGRLVRTLRDDAPAVAGPNHVVWDGRDDRGRRVSSGAYLVRIRAGAETGTGRLLLVR